VVCVLGLEREAELLVGLRRQLKVFRSFGARLLTKVEFLEHVKTLGTPIDCFIDGLLGLTISFEELRTGDQAQLMSLSNSPTVSKAPVLAIDIPTGIDQRQEKSVLLMDGSFTYMQNMFVAMGVPKKGLLETMALAKALEKKIVVKNGSSLSLISAWVLRPGKGPELESGEAWSLKGAGC